MDRFQIIIPMSGQGNRFKEVGFKLPKPLIKVAGKPIIAHVIDLFPGETDFIFICNEDHLKNKSYNMRNIILKYCPSGKILSIKSHKKGPVHAILEIEKYIDLNAKTVVNYCDFTCYWDWNDFKKKINKTMIDGAVPAYKGFHPHSLGATNYAYIKERKMVLLDIQEKQPFTNNKLDEYASSGTYYFKNGGLMISSFKELIIKKMHVNGEYYVSLSYITKAFHDLKTIIYPIKYFMQWGTPKDLKEYKEWHKTFLKLSKPKNYSNLKMDVLIMPMAGKGQRFLNEGYLTAKPMINISGQPMVVQSINLLANFKNYCFVIREDITNSKIFNNVIKRKFNNIFVKNLKKVSEGQAQTASLGLEYLNKKITLTNQHITFGVCDVGVLFNQYKLNALLEDESIDLIVWSRKKTGGEIANPKMYGWIKEKNNLIDKTSIKEPFIQKNNVSIITGIFTFKNQNIFNEGYKNLIKNKSMVNGEYYLDSVIDELLKLGKKCVAFEVDHYLSWGTPNELKTFEYWQSCFNSWKGHPYSIKKDLKMK